MRLDAVFTCFRYCLFHKRFMHFSRTPDISFRLYICLLMKRFQYAKNIKFLRTGLGRGRCNKQNSDAMIAETDAMNEIRMR